MAGFIEGADRGQLSLLPGSLDDWVGNDNADANAEGRRLVVLVGQKKAVAIAVRNHLAHHRLNGLAFVPDRLGDGNNLDAVLGELAKIELLFKGLPEEPAIAVHHNEVERVRTG
jgi:hypothetical protein